LRKSWQCVEHTGFGRLNLVGLNSERSPIKNSTVVIRRDLDDPHLRMILQNSLAEFRQAVSAFERYDQEIRLGLVDRGFDSGFFLDLANNLDVRLVAIASTTSPHIRRGLLATRTLMDFIRDFSARASIGKFVRGLQVHNGFTRFYSAGALRGLDGFQGNLVLSGTGTYLI
jgi:hypothetical protein